MAILCNATKSQVQCHKIKQKVQNPAAPTGAGSLRIILQATVKTYILGFVVPITATAPAI
jgi:hypothetical protein